MPLQKHLVEFLLKLFDVNLTCIVSACPLACCAEEGVPRPRVYACIEFAACSAPSWRREMVDGMPPSGQLSLPLEVDAIRSYATARKMLDRRQTFTEGEIQHPSLLGLADFRSP